MSDEDGSHRVRSDPRRAHGRFDEIVRVELELAFGNDQRSAQVVGETVAVAVARARDSMRTESTVAKPPPRRAAEPSGTARASSNRLRAPSARPAF